MCGSAKCGGRTGASLVNKLVHLEHPEGISEGNSASLLPNLRALAARGRVASIGRRRDRRAAGGLYSSCIRTNFIRIYLLATAVVYSLYTYR